MGFESTFLGLRKSQDEISYLLLCHLSKAGIVSKARGFFTKIFK